VVFDGLAVVIRYAAYNGPADGAGLGSSTAVDDDRTERRVRYAGPRDFRRFIVGGFVARLEETCGHGFGGGGNTSRWEISSRSFYKIGADTERASSRHSRHRVLVETDRTTTGILTGRNDRLPTSLVSEMAAARR